MATTAFFGTLKALAATEQTDPTISVIEFVFTDFLPNKNKQGVKRTEAENIIATGMNKPVKVNFLGDEVAGHKNAIPVGPIIQMSLDDDRIIGKAIIWKDEYAELASYLEKASASEGGVQFSWEIYFKNSTKDSDGTQWLEDVKVAGIAIVSDPAYSGRTPLLSFAETRHQAEELSEKIAEFVGGQMDPEMQALQEQCNQLTDMLYAMINQLYEALEDATAPPSPPELVTVMSTYSDLLSRLKAAKVEASQSAQEALQAAETELVVLRDYKQGKEAAEARSQLVETRSSALSSVMAAEDITEKLDFILNLNDEQFTQFVASLQTVKKATSSSNDKKTGLIPDFTSPEVISIGTTVKELAQAYRKYIN